ncbi:hypothetical protein GCU56_01665 [Geodermatophilus sabuli]|uniref:Uncharacterized protein n=1 Tax=Geodermatophilus sabuli TaxID=1564158 RepID=A0A7K3VVB8_9ACTN|nr:hypothetical protein [Geodermatophilus sabuli]NEK56581.1 hypothetical protein [Geodermatophilus sabuli]
MILRPIGAARTRTPGRADPIDDDPGESADTALDHVDVVLMDTSSPTSTP